MLRRLIAIAMLVTAFFGALGGMVALGNGLILIGVVSLVAAAIVAVGGWVVWDGLPSRTR